jgi:type I restriction enzyme S subunit
MSLWASSTLAEKAHLVSERVHPTGAETQAYIGLEHIGVGTLTLLKIGNSDGVQSHCFRFQQGDILFGKLRPYFRKVIRAPCDGLCTTEAWVVRPNSGVDAGFLFYVLANPAFVALCTRSAEGTRMPRARWAFVASTPMPWPDLGEQRRIAGILALFDAKIAVNRRMNNTLQALLSGLFRQTFGPAMNRRDAMGGWRRGTLGQIALRHGETADPSRVAPETPCVGLAHMTKASLALEAWGSADQAHSKKCTFRTGDLLFGRLRPYFKKVVVAPVQGICSPDVLVIRPREPLWASFVLGCMTQEPFIAFATAVSTGTRMPRASWKDLARYPIAVPPLSVLRRFHSLAQPLTDRLVANVRENRTLAAIRDALLPNLLAGTA